MSMENLFVNSAMSWFKCFSGEVGTREGLPVKNTSSWSPYVSVELMAGRDCIMLLMFFWGSDNLEVLARRCNFVMVFTCQWESDFWVILAHQTYCIMFLICQ